MTHRKTLASLLALAVLAAGASVLAGDRIANLLAGRSLSDDEILRQPPGFWTEASLTVPRRPRSPGAAEGDEDERARLISLPYLAGRQRAAGAGRGVVTNRTDRAWAGVNLYNSGHGPEAILVDMDGGFLHRWRLPFERAFPDSAPTPDTQYFRRVHLFPDGRLLALYQTGGLVFLDERSRPIGTCGGNFYNDFWVSEDGEGGRIWTIAKQVVEGDGDPKLDDFLVLLRYRGLGEGCREVRRISLTRALAESPFAGTLRPMKPSGDVLHANTVFELEDGVRTIPDLPEAFQPGRVLVSIREIDTLAVIDPRSGSAVWALRGPWRAQHEPSILPDGRILLLDNLGGDGGYSRVVEIDPTTGAIVRVRDGDPPESFHSSIAGTCARLPGGNLLVTLSVPGRAVELTPDGEPVWEFDTPHRAGPDDRLIAMLFEVQRLPSEYAEGWR